MKLRLVLKTFSGHNLGTKIDLTRASDRILDFYVKFKFQLKLFYSIEMEKK